MSRASSLNEILPYESWKIKLVVKITKTLSKPNPKKLYITVFSSFVQAHNDYDKDKFDTSLQPHVFQVAARAYRRLCDSEINQVR